MGQNTSNSVWKPCEDLQKTFDLCHWQQRVYNKVLRWNFVIDQILIFHHNFQINSLKILQCDFLDFFLILSLIVEVYLWWKLQASLIFLSGRICTIGGWLNTFLPHCKSKTCKLIYTSIHTFTRCRKRESEERIRLREWEFDILRLQQYVQLHKPEQPSITYLTLALTFSMRLKSILKWHQLSKNLGFVLA